MQKEKTDKSLLIDIQFFLTLFFFFWKGTSIVTNTHTPHTQTKLSKPTRGQNGVYQTPADANQLLSRGN